MTPDLSMLLHDPEKIRRQQVIDALPEGMDGFLEHLLWTALLDYHRMHGFAETRQKVAELLNEVAER